MPTKIIVIGYGHMGKIHTRILTKLGVLHGVVEIDETAVSELKGKIPVYETINEIPFIPDGVVIAVPTQRHLSTFMEVVKKFSGIKAILIEKPVFSTYDEFRKHRPILDAYKRKIIAGHVEMYNPVWDKLLEVSKDYGAIRSITVNRKGTVDDARIKSLGDVVMDVGVHDLSMVSKLVPSLDTLYATGVEKNNVINSAMVLMKSRHGQQVSLNFSREYSGRDRSMIIEQEFATLMVDFVAQTIEVRTVGELIGNTRVVKIPHGFGSSLKVYGEPLNEELVNLIEVANETNVPKVSIEDASISLRLIENIRDSIKTGEVIPIEFKPIGFDYT